MVLGVNKFLCCFLLETGGIFLGWLGLITHGFLVLVLIVLVAFRKTFFRLAIAMYQESESMQESIRTKREIENSDIIGFGAGFWWTMVAFIFGILFLRIWGYENLLNGTNKHNHKQVRIFVIIDAFFLVLLLIPCLYGIEKLEMESKQANGVGAQFELKAITTAP